MSACRDIANKPLRPLVTKTGFYYHQFIMRARVPYLHMMGHKGRNRHVRALEAYGPGQTVLKRVKILLSANTTLTFRGIRTMPRSNV